MTPSELAVSPEPVVAPGGEPLPLARRPRRPPSRMRRIRRSAGGLLAAAGRRLGAALRSLGERIPGGPWVAGRWRLLTDRWRRLPRTQARVVLVAVVAFSFAAGIGLAGLVLSPASDSVAGSTALGPVRIVLPEEVGPWSEVPTDRFEVLRHSAALGNAVIDEAWGAVTADAVVVSVLTAAAGTHDGLDAVSGPFDEAHSLGWDGAQPYRAGWQESDGVRELVLVVERGDGALVMLSVSGPVAAFASGALAAAFFGARLSG